MEDPIPLVPVLPAVVAAPLLHLQQLQHLQLRPLQQPVWDDGDGDDDLLNYDRLS